MNMVNLANLEISVLLQLITLLSDQKQEGTMDVDILDYTIHFGSCQIWVKGEHAALYCRSSL